MNTPVQAPQFFHLWVDACRNLHSVLFRDWTNCPAFTSHVFYEPHALIPVIAARLGLSSYCGYYSIDAILFAEHDLVPSLPAGQTWVRRIRVAFEHENYFMSGLFQEVSHLIITDCDLRVVVSYPGNANELTAELEYLHRVVTGSDRSSAISESGSLLFIVGWRDPTAGTIDWWGYIYRISGWERLP